MEHQKVNRSMSKSQCPVRNFYFKLQKPRFFKMRRPARLLLPSQPFSLIPFPSLVFNLRLRATQTRRIMAGHGDRSHPSGIDEERAATPSLSPKSLPRRRRTKWLGISLACILLGVVVVGVLALTVFRFRDPDLKLESIAMTNVSLLSRAPTSSSSSASVNVTLRQEIRVRNQNWGSFKIDDSVAVLTSRGARIYEGEIANPGATVEKRSSRREAVAIEAELINGTSYGSSNSSEVVEIGAYAYVSGEVKLLSVIKRRRSGSVNCTVSLGLATQAVQNFSCR